MAQRIWMRTARASVAVGLLALVALAAVGQEDSAAEALNADRRVEALLSGRRGAEPETLIWARRAVDLNERTFGVDSIATARSLVRLGQVLVTHSKYAESMNSLQRALRIIEAEPVSNPTDLATAKLAVGIVLMRQGKLEEAVSNLQEALQIYEQTLGSNHPRVGDALVSLGEAQSMRDSLAEGRALLESGLAILEAAYGPDSIMTTKALSELGYSHLASAEWSQASRYFEHGLAIAVTELGADSLQAAEDLLALGIVRNDMGDYATAAEFEARAAAILERLFGPSHPQLGRALRHLGVSLTNLGRFAEAEPVMLRSLAITEENHEGDSYAVGNALRSIGDNYYDAGKYEKAQSYSLRALEVFSKLAPESGPSTSIAYVLGDLGRSSLGLGDLRMALEYEERGLAIHQSVLGPAHPDNAVYLTDLARILFAAEQYDAAMDAAQRADAIIREHLGLITRVSPEEVALAYAETSRYAVDFLLSAVTEIPERGSAATPLAWDSEIRARGQVLDGLIERRRLLVDSHDPDLTTLISALQAATERLAKLIVRGPGSLGGQAFERELASARAELREAESALAARSEMFRGMPVSSQSGLRDVTTSLPPRSALVAFVRYGHVELATRPGQAPPPVTQSSPAYLAFVIPATGAAPIAIPLGTAAHVDGLVALWRSAITNEARSAGRASRTGEESYRKTAEGLRLAVWDPLFPALGAATEVFIVPDGSLNLVGFGALPTANGGYLAESGPRLHYLSAERDIMLPESARDTGGLLALSAPDFDDRRLFAKLEPRPETAVSEWTEGLAGTMRGARSACGGFRAMQFEPLPGAAMEAQQIVTLWEQTRAASGPKGKRVVASLSGSAASETMFKQSVTGQRVVHLATHGFFLGDECSSATDRASPSVDTAMRENPLLLSGLALAGANHRNDAAPYEEDGILTAQEIATLDLQGTEWAVLSACDTGLGAMRTGEGVFGLRRAFQLAGARTVILSLWSVEDDATRQWMAALYRHRFADGKSTSASLHDASLEMLQQRRLRGESTHPFYWAGFIAAGDWR